MSMSNRVLTALIVAAGLFIAGPLGLESARAEDNPSRIQLPEGVYIDLTKDFYEALRSEGGGSATVYSNDPSQQHLREIAVSTRFMVQTNLEILKQQEAMLHLLRRLLEKR